MLLIKKIKGESKTAIWGNRGEKMMSRMGSTLIWNGVPSSNRWHPPADSLSTPGSVHPAGFKTTDCGFTTQQAKRPGVEIQDFKGHMNVRAGEGLNRRPIMKWARRLNQSRGVGDRGAGTWKGRNFLQWKATALDLSDASLRWFQSHRRHSGVYSEADLTWKCLVRPTCSCISWEGSASFPVPCQHQRQELWLMWVREEIA